MSLPSTMYRVIDWAWRASTTFDAVSSITEATSSRLGWGFDMIFISRERLRALAMEGAAILVGRGMPTDGQTRNEKRHGCAADLPFPLLTPMVPKKSPPPMADSERHPFLQGLSKHRGAPPTVVVIFGASGDLTARKLIPAVYNLSFDNLLPADFFLIGFGRKPIPDEEFRTLAAGAIKEFSRR